MNFIKGWIQTNLSRRGFIFLALLGFYRFIFQSVAWARVEYVQVKDFLIRSIERIQKVDLKTWHLKIEGLVDKPISLSFDEIKALPQKIQTKNFICVEGWGLDTQKWEGVHLEEIFFKG
jgi:DMSO/TMAO reductase YedYZ molybdopterin-dependent catalytic subunit